jgi:hypothetical protein
MAVYKLFPTQDTTLYSDYNTLNAGLDSILDLSKTQSSLYASSSVGRALVQFSTSEIQNLINNTINSSITSGSFSSNLRLYNANIDGMAVSTALAFHPVYESWDMGYGRFNDLPGSTTGASWAYRSANSTNAWTVNGLPTGITSSYFTGNNGGANWYTASVTQSFSFYSTKDINVDITPFTLLHYSGTIANNGIIIKNTGSIEFNPNYQYTFNFFSRDTNTIYPPCLEFKWKDSTFNTGSTTTIGTENLLLSVSNNKNIFYSNEVVKLRVFAKEKYPQRNFVQDSLYIYNKLLPVSSSYSIIDLDTNNRVIDFDWNYTQLSADGTSSFFNLYMNGFEPERYYKVQIKSIINGGTYVYDDDFYFKVTQNV